MVELNRKERCACRVRRCETCDKCSRCGCAHDGSSVELKMARSVGGKQVTGGDSGKKRRSTTTCLNYDEEGDSDSDSNKKTPAKTPRRHERYKTPSSAAASSVKSTPATLTPGLKTRKSIQLIIEFFGLSSSISSNFPNEKERIEASYFDDLDRGNRVVAFIMSILQILCSILIPGDPKGLLRAVGHHIMREIGDSDWKECAHMAQLALPEKSIQRKVILAIMCEKLSFANAKEYLSIGKQAFTTARRHYRCLVSGNEIRHAVRSVMRYTHENVEQAVKFILSPVNIKALSWGTRKIKIDGNDRDFPRFTRVKIQEYIYRDYIAAYPVQQERICHGSFSKVVKSITSFDQKALKAIDYASGILMYDTIDLLRLIVKRVDDEVNRRDCDKLLDKLEHFLKYDYVQHRGIDPAAASHDISYGLGRGSCTSSCSKCQLPFQIVHVLKKHSEQDVHVLLDNCAEKFQLYLAHLVRVHNQRERIQEIHDGLKPGECLILMDYKMKFDPVYFREKTLEHFGKKGLSWHGAMVYYCCPDDSSVIKICYYDHISCGDSKQDWPAVFSITEGIVMQLKRDLSHITEVNIQTDNAKCYQNGNLAFGLFMMFKKHNLSLRSYIHTETQNGKGSIDAHFAVAMRHVLNFVNMGSNVISPVQLYTALQSNGGVGNTVAALFDLDRGYIDEFAKKYETALEFFAKIKRCNEIVFSDTSMLVYEYSGIQAIQIDMSDPSNPIGVLPGGGENDESDDKEDEEEPLDLNVVGPDDSNVVVDDLGEEQSGNEEFVDFRGTLTNCTFSTKILQQRQMRRRTVNAAAQGQAEGTLDEFITFNDGVENDLVCVGCNRTFQCLYKKDKHICRPARLPSDIVSVALRYAYKLVEDGEVDFINTRLIGGDLDNDDELDPFFDDNLPDYSPVSFEKGWALRAGYGKIYGAKYIEKYKKDIDELYSRGNVDQRHKMGPGRMLECLRRTYPGRLDLPSETEIRQRITSLVAKYKKHGTIDLKKRGIQEPFKGIISVIVADSQYKIKPKEALAAFVVKITEQNLTTHDDKPDDKHVKTFISQLKSKHKKDQGENLPGMPQVFCN